MRILGIESSCDDTSVALVDINQDRLHIVAEKTASQIDVHKKYGGVVPEIAGRQHAEAIVPVIEAVMADQSPPDAIAVTAGPGLVTGLLVGVTAAKTLSYLWNVPIIRTNHIEGHVYSVLIDDTGTHVPIVFPALCLIVSGGHSDILLMTDHGVYEKLGGTRDDAAGECFDKVAKLLGLSYPGGPKISELAATGNPTSIAFPRPMIDTQTYDMSFAGLKTAVLYWLQDQQAHNTTSHGYSLPDVCASFEQAIIDVLVHKTMRAIDAYQPNTLILAGGVSANKKLRTTLQQQVASRMPDISIRTPLSRYCMDNGAMIAVAAYTHTQRQEYTPWQQLDVDPQWRVYKS